MQKLAIAVEYPAACRRGETIHSRTRVRTSETNKAADTSSSRVNGWCECRFHMCVVYTPFKGQQPFKMVGTGRNHTEAKQVAALRLLQEMGFQVQSSPALPLDGYDEQMHKQTLSSASSRRLPSHSQSTRSLRDSPEYEPYQPSQPASDIEGSSEQEPEPEPDDESDEEGEIEADE